MLLSYPSRGFWRLEVFRMRISKVVQVCSSWPTECPNFLPPGTTLFAATNGKLWHSLGAASSIKLCGLVDKKVWLFLPVLVLLRASLPLPHTIFMFNLFTSSLKMFSLTTLENFVNTKLKILLSEAWLLRHINSVDCDYCGYKIFWRQTISAKKHLFSGIIAVNWRYEFGSIRKGKWLKPGGLFKFFLVRVVQLTRETNIGAILQFLSTHSVVPKPFVLLASVSVQHCSRKHAHPRSPMTTMVNALRRHGMIFMLLAQTHLSFGLIRCFVNHLSGKLAFTLFCC